MEQSFKTMRHLAFQGGHRSVRSPKVLKVQVLDSSPEPRVACARLQARRGEASTAAEAAQGPSGSRRQAASHRDGPMEGSHWPPSRSPGSILEPPKRSLPRGPPQGRTSIARNRDACLSRDPHRAEPEGLLLLLPVYRVFPDCNRQGVKPFKSGTYSAWSLAPEAAKRRRQCPLFGPSQAP